MRSIILSAVIIATLSGYPALAEDSTIKEPTRIEIDQANETFVFVIGNKPVALLDKDGLHLRESIGYGALMIDEGEASFDERLHAMGREADHD